jgi:hypothetical protein
VLHFTPELRRAIAIGTTGLALGAAPLSKCCDIETMETGAVKKNPAPRAYEARGLT